MNPIAFQLAVDATRNHAHSALPDAPMLPDPPEPPTLVWAATLRRGLAASLHRAADRIEPRTA